MTKLRTAFRPRRTAKEERAAYPRLDKGLANVQPRSYDAVAIRAHRHPCKAARQLAGRRFLVAEAPKLPLPSCNSRCMCAYEHQPDRREESRRAIDVGIGGSYFLGAEARGGLDRRISDRGNANHNYYDFMRERTADC